MLTATHHVRQRLLVIACCVVLFFGALLWPLPNTYRAVWVSSLLDLGHIPLLAVVTVALHAACAGRLAWACGFGVLLAAAGEAGQFLVGRSPSWADFAHGLAGVLLAAAALTFWRVPRSRRGLAASSMGAALVAGWITWGYGPVFVDALWAYRSFPVLADFRSPWEPQRWLTHAASVRRVPGEGEMGWQGEVEFPPSDVPLRGVVLCPIVGDWSGYCSLCCELSCREELPDLMLSVRDGFRVSPPQRRFELWTPLPEGRHRLLVDLQKLAVGGEFAAQDLKRIQSLHLCVPGSSQRQRLTIHRIWLE